MKKNLILTILISLIFVISPLHAQDEVGKLFSTRDAKQLFGEVTNERTVLVQEFKSFLNQTDKFIYISLGKWNYYLMGDNFNPIYPLNSKNVQIYYKFSKSKVRELLERNPFENNLSIQMRTDVLTMQMGDDVLELALPCPPYCGE